MLVLVVLVIVVQSASRYAQMHQKAQGTTKPEENSGKSNNKKQNNKRNNNTSQDARIKVVCQEVPKMKRNCVIEIR